jgi:hypothetical protein
MANTHSLISCAVECIHHEEQRNATNPEGATLTRVKRQGPLLRTPQCPLPDEEPRWAFWDDVRQESRRYAGPSVPRLPTPEANRRSWDEPRPPAGFVGAQRLFLRTIQSNKCQIVVVSRCVPSNMPCGSAVITIPPGPIAHLLAGSQQLAIIAEEPSHTPQASNCMADSEDPRKAT